MGERHMNNDYTPLSASSLIFMAAVQRLGEAASGKMISDKTGIKESATYNLASRLVANGYITSEREHVGGFTQYALTEKGQKVLAFVKKALK